MTISRPSTELGPDPNFAAWGTLSDPEAPISERRAHALLTFWALRENQAEPSELDAAREILTRLGGTDPEALRIAHELSKPTQ